MPADLLNSYYLDDGLHDGALPPQASELDPTRIGCAVVGGLLSPCAKLGLDRFAEFIASFEFMGSATCYQNLVPRGADGSAAFSVPMEGSPAVSYVGEGEDT